MAPERVGKTDEQAGQGDALTDAILTSVPPAMLPPLFAPSAGAFAAAAVMGIGFANQMAGAYLGFLKGAVETSRAMAEILGAPERLDEAEPAAKAEPAVPAKDSATILPMARKAEAVGKPDPKPVAVVSEAKPAPKAPRKTAGAKRQPKGKSEATAVGNDLKRLPGVGPKLEQMLRARGIATLAAVAALKDADVAALDRDLGLDGRIVRDGWVETAAQLTRT